MIQQLFALALSTAVLLSLVGSAGTTPSTLALPRDNGVGRRIKFNGGNL